MDHEFDLRPQIPRATYRLQFTEHFTFRDALDLVPYLDVLGIGAAYASPLLRARTGSTHGYDICDHSQLNPQLGTPEDFSALADALHTRGLGLVVDIVPNHMGIGESCNAWWMDVLENGPSSAFASYFDISWHPVKPELENKVLLPILGDQYGNVLESGQLQLLYRDGAFMLAYFERRLPIAPRTSSIVLTPALERLGEVLPASAGHLLELQSILTALSHLPPRTEKDPDRIAERHREWQVIKRRIADLYQASGEFRTALEQTLADLNGTPGEPRSFDRLDALVNAQAYRLAYWRVAAEEINYRRFFDINDMTAIRVERPEVFAATHGLILRLLVDGQITGLRVDHPDGLWNPTDYFHKLQCEYLVRATEASHPNLDHDELDRAAGAWLDRMLAARSETHSAAPELPLYVAAEKILSESEPLPHRWAVDGTTGYDFCNAVNALYVDSANEKAFNKIYSHLVGGSVPFTEIVYQAKRTIMRTSLASEINSLAHQLERISEKNRHYRDFTLNALTVALREVIAALNIYRTYIDVALGAVSERDASYIEAAVNKARRRNPDLPDPLLDFVRDTLLLRNLAQFSLEDQKEVCYFVMRWQQMTSPIMAKGVEDTAFYIYNRLVSLNEVGSNPSQFGLPPAALHRHNAAHLERWPHTLLATATHDTKRGEDVRARLNVLSELPDEWRKLVSRWRRLNQSKKGVSGGEPIPDANDEYLLYQTLVGAWPLGATEEEFASFRERIVAYMQKATKEAKLHTSWLNPNAEYDEAVEHFVRRLLPDKRNDAMRATMGTFAERVAFFGRINSLSQTLLKLTSPGVPDVYQGTELFDFSLVDPDNRRPVDYPLRGRLLRELQERIDGNDAHLLSLARELADDRIGQSKLYLLWRVLNWRRERLELFSEGSYLPIQARGDKHVHVFAFARAAGGEMALTLVPRLVVGLLNGEEKPPFGRAVWNDTTLLLSADYSGCEFRNLFTGQTVSVTSEDGIPGIGVGEILSDFPVALLVRSERRSDSSFT